MQADGWISAPALPLFSLPDSTVLHPRQEARSRGADFMAASVGLDKKLERGAKRGGDTFHPLRLTVPGVCALHVCGRVSPAVLCLSQMTSLVSVHPSHDFFLCLLTFYHHELQLWGAQTQVLRNIDGLHLFLLLEYFFVIIKQFLKMLQPCVKLN